MREIKSTTSSTTTELSSIHFSLQRKPTLIAPISNSTMVQTYFCNFILYYYSEFTHTIPQISHIFSSRLLSLCWNCSKLVFYIFSYPRFYSISGLVSNVIFSWNLLCTSPLLTIPLCFSIKLSLYWLLCFNFCFAFIFNVCLLLITGKSVIRVHKD